MRPEDWVQLDELSASNGEPSSGVLALHLYRVEPDPHAPYPAALHGSGGVSRAPLLLNLHYAITYRSESQESLEAALGSVLRAFHSMPVLDQRNYLSSDEKRVAEAAGLSIGRLEVSLESPALEHMEPLWRGRASGTRLALFYHVRSAQVPALLEARPSAVKVSRLAEPETMPAAKGDRG